MIAQVFRFGLVGVFATSVHMILGITLLGNGWPLHAANGVAFCWALVIGFTGHYLFSFHGHSIGPLKSFSRYLAVAVSGFVLNECIVLVATVSEALGYETALLTPVIIAAVFTFFLSRLWAFN